MRYLTATLWTLIFPALIIAQADTVGLKMELNRQYYQSHRENKIYLKASIDTGALSKEQNAEALNIALVVDRSGSMAGEPIEHLRNAIIEFIGRLSEDDWISLTVYGSTARTLIESQTVGSLVNPEFLIQQIEAEGGAAPFEAINLAASQLRKNVANASINRLIFLSDGRATSGPRESDDFIRLTESLNREGISVSTIGLGEDFDEDLLKQMAELSGSEFYFAETGGDLADVFSDQIQKLGNVAAEDVVLSIRFRNSIRPEEILGREGEISGRLVTINIGKLLHHENPFVLVSAMMPGHLSFLDQMVVADAELTYVSIDEDAKEPVTIEASVRTRFVDTSPLVWKSFNFDVVYSVIAHDIAESIREAIDFADEGELDRAIRELEGTYKDLRSLNYDLEDPVIEAAMNELEPLIESLKSRGLDRIDRKVMTLKVFQAIQQRSSTVEEMSASVSEDSPEL